MPRNKSYSISELHLSIKSYGKEHTVVSRIMSIKTWTAKDNY